MYDNKKINVFVFICIGVEYLGTFCSVLFEFRKYEINYIAHSLRIPGVSVTYKYPRHIVFPFLRHKPHKINASFASQCFSMALKPKDVRVPCPVQLILDCHWLVCAREEGLTDK